jgi:hypothetical protein
MQRISKLLANLFANPLRMLNEAIGELAHQWQVVAQDIVLLFLQ